MKRFTSLMLMLLCAVATFAAVDEGLQNKKVSAVGEAATSIDTDTWYLLYNCGRGLYVSEETSSFRMRATSNFTTDEFAVNEAGYLFKFEATGNTNEYYIKSGNGLYFTINQGGSAVSNTPVAYTVAQIGDNAGHFYGQMVSDGRILNGNAAGGTLAGWNTTVPEGIGDNSDYQFLPVTLEDVSIVTVTYKFMYNGDVKYTQETLVEEGAAFPDYTVVLPYGVSAVTKPAETVSTENATQEIALSVSLPFTVSTLENDGSFGEGMHWYTLALRDADLTYDAANNKSFAADVTVKTPANFYAFTGNPFDGYKLFNYAAGSSKIAWSATVDDTGAAIPFTELTSVTENTDWLLFANGEGYTLRREDNEYGYINSRNGALSYWIAGAAATDVGSRLTLDEVTDDVLAEFIETYKTTTNATLDEWANLSVVFDAELIATAKAAVSAVEANGIATFATIDSKLTDVTDAVAAKMFTFQTTATDTGRNGVWVSANATTMKAIGADAQDYNAIWSLRHAGGTSFYMYNELNSVYMGAPSSNCPLTATPSAAYTFEIVDAENSIVEMHTNGETMHASNHDDNKLLNWDNDENASRWYIRTIDVAADIQTILDGLTEADYAETPALGQYTKAAYDALVEARTSARTVAEVEAAIAAFNKSKNIPVYFITSAHTGYAAGSAIYYDGAWKWKTANKYDKQMWMTIPEYTEENVPTVNAYSAEGTSYEICDYLTGTAMRGKSVQIVAIDGWENAYNLQYNADATSTDAAQHAASGGSLVNWNPATTDGNQASAWYVDYLGTSYELDQLTDEKIAALVALQDAYNAKAFYADAVMGDGLGEYTGNRDAIVAVLPAAETIGAKTLAEQAALSVDEITSATTALNDAEALVINLPAQGKYYRIKGACDATLANYYITGNTNSDGGRIACKADADASTIFFYNDGKLLAYNSGLYIGVNSSNYKFSSVDGTTPATEITFAGSPRQAGAYTVKSADRFLFYKVYNGTVELDRYQDNTSTNLDWTLEEVTELPVTVTAAGYATLYAPVALTVPTTGVTAHTVTLNSEWATLSEALEVIPANTGVVLAGEGSHSFAITTADAFEGENALEGTVATTHVDKDAYVLSYIDTDEDGVKDEVGFYTATKNQAENTAFQNNSHKAYLVVPAELAEGIAYYSFRFGEGTTGVEKVEIRNEKSEIYDLTGRRVEAITAPGIYIVGGKKVLVK